jgi:hypothetical protein
MLTNLYDSEDRGDFAVQKFQEIRMREVKESVSRRANDILSK